MQKINLFNDRFISNIAHKSFASETSFEVTQKDSFKEDRYSFMLKNIILQKEDVLSYEKLSSNSRSQYQCKLKKDPIQNMYLPNMGDNFYTHLLDWSATNVISLGLDNCAYIWSSTRLKPKPKRALELPTNEAITSVAWNNEGLVLTIGTNKGDTHLLDITKNKIIKTFSDHQNRVGCLSWNNNILCSGSKDRNILVRDVRSKKGKFLSFSGHSKEICKLAWSNDKNILASGGNDSKIILWNLKDQKKEVEFTEHHAGVRSLVWDPNRSNILISGGGTDDKTIKTWNCRSYSLLNSVDTESQVCNLLFNSTTNEIVSTHGFSKNEICLWKYDTMEKVASLNGHSKRVLHAAISPCNKFIVSGSSDESLKMWDISSKESGEIKSSLLFPGMNDLR